MAWQDEMVPMLRLMISDMDSTPVYDDTRLEQLLTLAGRYVQQEINLKKTYTISVANCTLTPDPTATATKDDLFVDFTVLKAACFTDWSTYRAKALLSGIKSRCGPAVLETLGHLTGFKDLIDKGPCKAYETLKDEYMFGNPQAVKLVLSPFRGNNFDPQSLTHGDVGHRGGGFGHF